MEGLRRQRHMLLLVGDAKESDAMPDAMAQLAARDFDARTVVAVDCVLNVLANQLGARLDGAVERALGVGQRRVALAGHGPLGLHSHLGVGRQGSLASEPVGSDQESSDGDPKRVVFCHPILTLHLVLDDDLAVLAPVGVLPKLLWRQVLLELQLCRLRLNLVEAMGQPVALYSLKGVEKVNQSARHCVAQVVVRRAVCLVAAWLERVPVDLTSPELICLVDLLAQALRPKPREAAALTRPIEAILRSRVAEALRADKIVAHMRHEGE
eukprot:1544610-Prymnesium_polylepis.3